MEQDGGRFYRIKDALQIRKLQPGFDALDDSGRFSERRLGSTARFERSLATMAFCRSAVFLITRPADSAAASRASC